MNGKRPPVPKPSAIDQALASFKETWLRAEGEADEMMHAAFAARPVAPIATPGTLAGILEKGCGGEAVQELRIRLAGFGGLLPGDEFDDDVADSVQQFEKDVMKRNPTGKVDQAFAAALDKFAADWPIDVEGKLACPCVVFHRLNGCKGFGKGQFKGEYWPGHKGDEAYHKYEYPGIHRSVLWASRALMHYAGQDHPNEIRFDGFSSAYRCHVDNSKHTSKNKKTGKKAPRTSTNHMGKALDIHFAYNDGNGWISGGGDDSQTCEITEKMRDVAVKRLNAQKSWKDKGKFSLETAGQGAVSWVHIDLRAWSAVNLGDSFFIQSTTVLNGGSFSALLANPSSFHP